MLNNEAVAQLQEVVKNQIHAAMGTEMNQLKDMFNQLSVSIQDSIDSKIQKKVEETTEEMRVRMKEIENKEETLGHQFKKRDDQLIEDRKRRNLIFYGLGSLQTWKERETAVFKVVREKLEVSCRDEDIDEIVKLDRSKDDSPILVKFTTLRKKLEILGNRRKLKDTRIYIDEDFSKEVVEKRKELRKTMKIFKEEGKQVYLKRDKLWVDGQLWSNEQNEDVTMQEDHNAKEKNNTKKRERSPSEANTNRGRLLKKPSSAKHLTNLRARSAGAKMKDPTQSKINKYFNPNTDIEQTQSNQPREEIKDKEETQHNTTTTEPVGEEQNIGTVNTEEAK
uniref:Uncharacterized protein n=1 Tax=Cacopsylla melanoneura TaxID=428564 RepID=A0A8D8Z3K6_9HEMI